MKLKHRLFPYPVIGENYNDYKTSIFTGNLKYNPAGNKLSIDVFLKTNNTEIIKSINEDKLIYAVHVECDQTSYRKVIMAKSNDISFSIEDSKVTGKIIISTFIIVNKDIRNFQNNDFDDDYYGVSFNFKRGNIIGIGSQWVIETNKSKDELGKLPSIFSILVDKNNKGEFTVNLLNANKIEILLSEKDYINYKKIAKIRQLEGVFHSMIVLPVLISVFDQMSIGGTSELEEYRWFKALKKSLKRYNIILNDETIKNEGSIKLAQKILDMPLERALENLSTEIFKEGEME